MGALIFDGDPNRSIATGWVIGGGLTIAYVLLGLRGRDGLRLDAPYPALIAFGIGFGVAISLDLVAIIVTGRVIEPPELAPIVTQGGALLWLLLGVFVVVIQPIAEELIFRGTLQPALQAAQNVWVSIIITSVLFGLFHRLLYLYPASDVPFSWWYTLAEPLAFGVVLGVARAATGSTRAAIVVHVGWGVFALLKTLLIVAVVG